jgi:hypothetical protein
VILQKSNDVLIVGGLMDIEIDEFKLFKFYTSYLNEFTVIKILSKKRTLFEKEIESFNIYKN